MNQPVINIVRRGVSYEEYSSSVSNPISKDEYLDLVMDRLSDITWTLQTNQYDSIGVPEVYSVLAQYSHLSN